MDMSGKAAFRRRPSDDGNTASVCTRCNVVVAESKDILVLEAAEFPYVCDFCRLEYWEKLSNEANSKGAPPAIN